MQRRRHGCPRVLPARLGAMPIGQISKNGRNLPCSVREALGKLAPRDRSRTQSRIPQRVRGGLPASTVTRGANCTSRSWYRTKTSTSIRQHDEVFAAHSAWITGLREHSTRLWGAAVPSPAALVAWGSVADQRAPRRALQRGPFDFVDDPVYRSASAHLSWQPANDELDFDSDEPVYRSLGGFGSSTGGFAVDYVDVDVWMRSGRAGLTRGLDAAHAPARVQRQSAVSHLGPVRAPPPPPPTHPPHPTVVLARSASREIRKGRHLYVCLWSCA